MLKLYNTTSRSVEKFKPIQPKRASIYSCGPTVYSRQHIGNMRKGIFDDILRRTLRFNGYSTYSVTNITDVGHLVSDADDGEDKMETGASANNTSAQEIAQTFTTLWKEDLAKLNVLPDNHYPKATDYIKEQINLIKRLEKKGFTYIIKDGVYFDSAKFPEYGDFANINVEGLDAGSRVSIGEKKAPTDFALWKFSPEPGQRQQEWDSPWGVGFPGWHSECVVMSDTLLHAPFDIHTGGKEHISIHHTNEIAQFKADREVDMANYWLHGYHLTVDKKKMSKSAGTTYILDDIINKGYNPLAFRLLMLMAHYRSDTDFSWTAMDQAQKSLTRLNDFVTRVSVQPHQKNAEISLLLKKFRKQFRLKLNNDLDTPQALAEVFSLIKNIHTMIDADSPIPRRHILKTLIWTDRILGLNLVPDPRKESSHTESITPEVTILLTERQKARDKKDFATSDQLRDAIADHGYTVKDTSEGQLISKNR